MCGGTVLSPSNTQGKWNVVAEVILSNNFISLKRGTLFF